MSVRYRAVQQFTRWCYEEGEIDADTMARLRPPQVPEQPVDVIPPEDITRLLRSVSGRDYVSRRDAAIIRVFLDTGMRLGELAGITGWPPTITGSATRATGRPPTSMSDQARWTCEHLRYSPANHDGLIYMHYCSIILEWSY